MDVLRDQILIDKNENEIHSDDVLDTVDVIILLFSANSVDKNDVIKNFYKIYDMSKLRHFPIEVIYVPMDESEADMKKSFADMPNWYRFQYDDDIVCVLKYMFGIGCVPKMVVVRTDNSIITMQGVTEITEKGIDALSTWLSTADQFKRHMENLIKIPKTYSAHFE